jgi:hypothetical protein
MTVKRIINIKQMASESGATGGIKEEEEEEVV